MKRKTTAVASGLAIGLGIASTQAAITGIPSGTPETVGLGVGIGNPFPSNPDHVEYYAGDITFGDSVPTYHSAAVGGAPASLAWFKFTSDGVSDIILDTFGSTASCPGPWGCNPGTSLGVFDSSGNLIHKQDNVRSDPEEEPVFVPPNYNGYELEAPSYGNRFHNTPHDPLDPIAKAGGNNATNYIVTAIGPAPDYVTTLEPTDSPIIWRSNLRGTSQLAFLKNPDSNPLWDPLHPDYDPDADWDQYPILPAGDYFIAVTGGARFSGYAPDMVDQTKQVGDVVQNASPALPDDGIPDDGAGNPVPFGFTSIHPMGGIMVLNARRPGDFNSTNIADATDIDILFDRIVELSGQGVDANSGVSLDGLPLYFVESGWEPETSLTPTDMMLDLTGNSRIDMGDVFMLVHNILGTEIGDANLDGVIDDTDKNLVNANLGSPGGWADGDFNGDDLVTQADLDILLANLPTLDGDLNGDGFVGVDDLNIVLVNWNQNVTPGDLGSGDPTGEGFVGVDDLNIVLVNWNNGTPPAGSAIPEPTAMALLALGSAAMLRRRLGRD